MSHQLSWLAEVLRDAGCKVIEGPSWPTRGHGDMKAIRGVLCHHTASNKKTPDSAMVKLCREGRPDLPGPLSQTVLGREGTWHIIAAGKCFHAGKGSWAPMGLKDNGNSHLIGIEAINAGDGTEPWPEVQMEAYAKGCAAMLNHLRLPVSACIGHKEYAPKRKIDPNFPMDDFRERVEGHM